MFVDEFADLMLSYGIRFSRGVPYGSLAALEEAIASRTVMGFRQCVNGTQAVSEAFGYAQLNERPALLCLDPDDMKLVSQVQISSSQGFGCIVVSVLGGSFGASSCDTIVVDTFTKNPIQEVWQVLSQAGQLERPVTIRVARELLQSSVYKAWGYRSVLSHEQAMRHVVDRLHENDILVTSCGHVSQVAQSLHADDRSFTWYKMPLDRISAFSFAASVAETCPDKRIWCVEGDGGSVLSLTPRLSCLSQWYPNLRHIVLCDGLVDGARSGVLHPDLAEGLRFTRGGNTYPVQDVFEFAKAFERLKSERMFACIMAIVSH